MCVWSKQCFSKSLLVDVADLRSRLGLEARGKFCACYIAGGIHVTGQAPHTAMQLRSSTWLLTPETSAYQIQVIVRLVVEMVSNRVTCFASSSNVLFPLLSRESFGGFSVSKKQLSERLLPANAIHAVM